MRHFVVLGFTSNSQKEAGELLHLGADRSQAIESVNTPDEEFVRKELYELSVPNVRRHAVLSETTEPDAGAEPDNTVEENEDEDVDDTGADPVEDDETDK